MLRHLVCINDLEVECECFVSVQAAEVPRVRATDANFCLTAILRLLLQRCDLSNSAGDLEFLGACGLDFGYEAHLELTAIVDLEELLETLLEHGVGKRVGHDVEATSLLKARLHLERTNLIDICCENVHDDT